MLKINVSEMLVLRLLSQEVTLLLRSVHVWYSQREIKLCLFRKINLH